MLNWSVGALVMALMMVLAILSSSSNTFAAAKEGDKKMDSGKNPVLVMETSLGTVEFELFADKAPISTANFLKYADDGFYNGTIFHRVIPTFMIQGGGFTEAMVQKPVKSPIKNEATNGLKNERGTLAMARTGVVDSATSQFFINVKDNSFLDHRGTDPSSYGYAVFGKVTSGLDVVDKIKAVQTSSKGPYDDVPVTAVVIKSIKRK
jgi:cyclophilin family peptidyl-prolyl cis-trans isomerase